jgi:hypothetical protein
MEDCVRPPAIGDVGTVVGLTPPHRSDDPRTRFIVELGDEQGYCVWLAEFSRDEIRLVSRPSAAGNGVHDQNPRQNVGGMTPEIFERLRGQWLSEKPLHDIHRKYVDEECVLPLASDMGGFYGLDRSGQVLEFEWDSSEPAQPVRDPRLLNRALFQGAAKYPILRSLLPARPVDALTCEACHGTGKTDLPHHLQDKVVCYCGGAGWLPAGTPQFGDVSQPPKRWWQFWRR